MGVLESFRLRIRELAGWVDSQPWVRVLMGHVRKQAWRELVTVWGSHWEEAQREVRCSGYLVQPKSKANISAVRLSLVSFAMMVSKTLDLAV